jgi:hypothetical protein
MKTFWHLASAEVETRQEKNGFIRVNPRSIRRIFLSSFSSPSCVSRFNPDAILHAFCTPIARMIAAQPTARDNRRHLSPDRSPHPREFPSCVVS